MVFRIYTIYTPAVSQSKNELTKGQPRHNVQAPEAIEEASRVETIIEQEHPAGGIEIGIGKRRVKVMYSYGR